MARHLHSPVTRAVSMLTGIGAACLILVSLFSAQLPGQVAHPHSSPRREYLLTATAEPQDLHTTWVAPMQAIPQSPPPARCTRPVATRGGGWERPEDLRTWTDADRSRVRRIAYLVSREMGASLPTRRLLARWTRRESNITPHEVHLMRGDVRAARKRASRDRVAAMGRTWHAHWGYGRGLYGMQPSLYIPRWDAQASLDVLCDPVIATIVAVWSARVQSRECARRGFEPTILVSNRRWGSGHCSPRAKDADTRRWWAEHRGNADARADWGSAWPEGSTDRGVILAHMRREIAAQGL